MDHSKSLGRLIWLIGALLRGNHYRYSGTSFEVSALVNRRTKYKFRCEVIHFENIIYLRFSILSIYKVGSFRLGGALFYIHHNFLVISGRRFCSNKKFV